MWFAPNIATVIDVLARRELRRLFGGGIRFIVSFAITVVWCCRSSCRDLQVGGRLDDIDSRQPANAITINPLHNCAESAYRMGRIRGSGVRWCDGVMTGSRAGGVDRRGAPGYFPK